MYLELFARLQTQLNVLRERSAFRGTDKRVYAKNKATVGQMSNATLERTWQ